MQNLAKSLKLIHPLLYAYEDTVFQFCKKNTLNKYRWRNHSPRFLNPDPNSSKISVEKTSTSLSLRSTTPYIQNG